MPGPDHERLAAAPGETYAAMQRAWEILGRLNALAPGDFDAARALLSELTGHELDPSVRLLPPFHTDSGRNLRFGRNGFVNHGCTATDLGGIDIGDDVMIGPNVQLISSGTRSTRRSAARTRILSVCRAVLDLLVGSTTDPRRRRLARTDRKGRWSHAREGQTR